MPPVPSRKGKGGPKTPEGKARSSMNALKHGLTSRYTIVENDEREVEFERLRRVYREGLKPRGPEAERLVDEIAHDTWNLERADALETAAMNRAYDQAYARATGPEKRREMAALRATVTDPEVNRIRSYQWRIAGRLFRAQKALNKLKSAELFVDLRRLVDQ